MVRTNFEKKIVNFLASAISIDTQNPPGKEKEFVNFVKRWLKREKVNLKIKEYEPAPRRSNLILSYGKGKRTLLLLGHTDTVPAGENWKTNPLKAEIKGGKIFGRGASDDKGPLTSAFFALVKIAKEKIKLKGKVVLVMAADEETGGKFGIDWLIKKKVLKSDFTIVTEPSGISRIEKDEKGLVWVKIKTFGRQAHGSRPELGDNAIEKMIKILTELKKLKLEGKHKILGKPTLNIGKIKGGTKVNVVPASCEAELDFRILPGQNEKFITSKLKNIFKKLSFKKGKDFHFEILHYGAPIEVSAKDPLVLALREAIKSVLKKEPEITGTPGGTDRKGILGQKNLHVGVIYGPGEPETCHIANEFIKIEDLIKGVEIYKRTIKELLS